MIEPRPITPIQIKTIKTLQRHAGLDDAAYRNLLRRSYGKTTCKDLTYDEAHSLIVSLRVMMQTEHKRSIPDRLNFRQKLAILMLWQEVSYLPPDQQDAGLRAFLLRQCGVEVLDWVPASSAPSIICALRAMIKQKEKPNEPYS